MPKNNNAKPNAYSNYFEVQLDAKDFGKDRPQHNKICNAKLLEQLRIHQDEQSSFHADTPNETLIRLVKLAKLRSPMGFVWEHCSSITANGRFGIMRLVPKKQHQKLKNINFWNLIHPDFRSRGGYNEWAVPAGASLENSTVKGIKEKENLNELTIDKISATLSCVIHRHHFN